MQKAVSQAFYYSCKKKDPAAKYFVNGLAAFEMLLAPRVTAGTGSPIASSVQEKSQSNHNDSNPSVMKSCLDVLLEKKKKRKCSLFI